MNKEVKVSQVNIIAWAHSAEAVQDLIKKILDSGHEEDGHHTQIFDDGTVQVNCYARWTKGSAKASPKGITDILVGHIPETNNEEALASLLSYKNNRKGIPYIYLVSDADLKEYAEKNGFEFIKYSTVGKDTQRIFIRQALKLDSTLRSVFDRIDTEGNGYINQDQVLSLSQELGHELNEQDANEIVKTLANSEGKVTYERFKNWWVFGRANFSTFRRLIEVEMSVNSLIKKSSSVYHNYLERLNSEANNLNEISKEINNSSKTNIMPIQNFETGLGMSMHMTMGKECDLIVDKLPDYYTSDPLVYGLELKIKDVEKATQYIEKLEQVKSMAVMVPQVQEFLNMGLNVDFRKVDTSIFIDVHLGGMIGDSVIGQLGDINLKKYNSSGTVNHHFYSALNIEDIWTSSLDTILEKLTLFKNEGWTEILKINEAVDLMYNFMAGQMTFNPPPELQGQGEEEAELINQTQTVLASLVPLIKAVGSVVYFFLDYKYDHTVVKKAIVNLVNISMDIPEEIAKDGSFSENHPVTQMFEGQREGIKSMVVNYAQSYKMMILPFIDLVKDIDLDIISFNYVIGRLRVLYQMNIHFKGLTKVLGEILGD